jgi:hypothetical protein
LWRCVGPVMTGGKVRWTRREGHDMVVFRFDMTEGQICPKRREGTITGPKQRYLSAKIWANTSEGKTFVSRWQVRSFETESRGDDAKCKCRNGSDKWWLQAPSFFFIVFRIYNVFQYNNPMLHFNTTIQLQHISSHAHAIQIGWGRVAPACREHFRGSSEVGRFKSSRHHLARRGATPVNTSK